MTNFREYSEYYDIIYSEKDYSGEVEFVLKILGDLAPMSNLLELGCGTGRHAEAFASRGIRVTGIDRSEEMVKHARERSERHTGHQFLPAFEVGDIRSLRLARKYEAVVSLFHVFSYQTSNSDLAAAFKTAADHLAPGGKFLFDFWYGPAVLSDPPVVRIRRLHASDFDVTRIAEPVLLTEQNRVDVHYELLFANRGSGSLKKISETHPMRYFFLPEIEDYLSRVGLQTVRSGAWMTQSALSSRSWYGWVLSERKG
jgi:SAM-dependent methyltransferase